MTARSTTEGGTAPLNKDGAYKSTAKTTSIKGNSKTTKNTAPALSEWKNSSTQKPPCRTNPRPKTLQTTVSFTTWASGQPTTGTKAECRSSSLQTTPSSTGETGSTTKRPEKGPWPYSAKRPPLKSNLTKGNFSMDWKAVPACNTLPMETLTKANTARISSPVKENTCGRTALATWATSSKD